MGQFERIEEWWHYFAREREAGMKAVKVIAVLLGFPLFGAIAGIIVFSFAVHPDPDTPSGPAGALMFAYLMTGALVSLVPAQVFIIGIIEKKNQNISN